MKESFKGRVNLPEGASTTLLRMLNELKATYPHIEINASTLCSWIVENYAHQHFDDELKRIGQAFFNPKRYMTEMLKSAQSNADIEKIMRTASEQMNDNATSRRKKKVAASEPIERDPVELENDVQS